MLLLTATTSVSTTTNCVIYPIYEFRGTHYFLSNFFPCKFTWQGIEWPSSEHAYQAAKFPRASWHLFTSGTAGQVKKLGRGKGARADWDVVRVEIMRSIIREKFCQNIELMEQLLATGDAELQEGNWWGDRFWGISPKTHGKGENNLGKLLMSLRDEFSDSCAAPQVQGIIYL